jgi:FkbM family methyltransferase
VNQSEFQSRLIHLRDRGFVAREVLDIGAYKGWFAGLVRGVFPDCRIHLFEANEAHSGDLAAAAQKLGRCEVHVELLGSEPDRETDFYTLDERRGVPSTGSSIFRERTQYYASPVVLRKRTTTLDGWFARTNPARESWRDHGLVKLDVQGAEIAVLRGAQEFLTACQPRYYLVETSVQQFNEGAPLIDDVFAFFRPFARMRDVWSVSYDQSGALLQMDVLFERVDSRTN